MMPVSRNFLQVYTGTDRIPATLRAMLDRVDGWHAGDETGRNPKRAVFDLDNTLVVGDVGEAAFAGLLADGHKLSMKWPDYVRLRETNADHAFAAVVETMSGLPVSDLISTTIRVLARRERSIPLGPYSVPIPYPHPVMQNLVHLLHGRGYAVYVITGTNQVSARIACSEWFDIPEERVFGIRQELNGERLTSVLRNPLPIRAGKVEIYRMFVGSDAPRITGTDSTMDLPLLNLTEEGGLALWLGRYERREIIALSVPADVMTFAVYPPSRVASHPLAASIA